MDVETSAYTVVTAISDPGAGVAVRHLVHTHARFEIMREVPNAVMAIEACRVLSPDVLIVTDDSPGLRGSEVLGEIRLNNPDTMVILVATYAASYLRDIDHSFVAATIAIPDSISSALDAVADVLDDPEVHSVPERRRTDRRLRQDWSQVFAERRAAGRRDGVEEEVS